MTVKSKIATVETEAGSGRKATTKSISNMPETWEWIDKRIESLAPNVKDRSHYFQLLVQKDKEMGLLGPIKNNETSDADHGRGQKVAQEMAAEVIRSIRQKRKPRV